MEGEVPSKKLRKPYTITRPRDRWTSEEHDRFLEALLQFGRDWKKIEDFVGTKTTIQIRSHAQKYFLKIQKIGLSAHVPPPHSRRKTGPHQQHQISSVNDMAMSATLKIALAVSVFGCLSFIFGCIAENKKPDKGTPNTKGDVVVCHYPNDPSIALGALSIIFLVASCVAGQVAVFFPYKAKSVPKDVLFSNISLVVFYIVAQGVTALALGLTLWATVTEGLHRHRNTHHNLETDCPTAKTGLFGGAAFLSLDACLFWLVCQMLTLNAHSDYLDRDEDSKGEYGEVLAADFYTSGTRSKV